MCSEEEGDQPQAGVGVGGWHTDAPAVASVLHSHLGSSDQRGGCEGVAERTLGEDVALPLWVKAPWSSRSGSRCSSTWATAAQLMLFFSGTSSQFSGT